MLGDAHRCHLQMLAESCGVLDRESAACNAPLTNRLDFICSIEGCCCNEVKDEGARSAVMGHARLWKAMRLCAALKAAAAMRSKSGVRIYAVVGRAWP